MLLVLISPKDSSKYEHILFDTTHQAFTHDGHLNVALSRITKYDGISFFTLQSFVTAEEGTNEEADRRHNSFTEHCLP